MLDGLKPYSEYKDTGEPWIGSIPAHWRIDRVRASVKTCQNGLWGSDPDGEDDLTCVRVADFDRVNLRVKPRVPTQRALPAKERIGRLLQREDLLLEKSGGGDLQPVGVVVSYDRDAGPAVCSNFVARMVVAPGFEPRFLVYLHAALYSYGVNKRSIKQTTGIQNLDAYSYLCERVGFPPPAEQAGIVRFLGAVDRKVNRFIRAKRRLIEVLTEQKQAIITHAVTKGLNPAAPLKPSGIDWLGDVPEHWEVRKLRLLVDTLGGMTPSKADQSFWNGDVPWVSPKDMKSVEIVGSIDHITQAALAQTNITLIPSPAVLIVVRGMILARTFPVGVTTLPVTINQDMKALRPRNSPVGVNALYLRHLLSGLGDVVKMLIEESGHGTRVLRTDLWRNLPLPVPPRSEQEAICDYITNQTAVFDQAAGQARREIDLIRQYRTRLVADVVTGKVDVRAAAAAIPDEAADPGPDPGAGEPGDDADPGEDDADGGADLEPALGAAGTEGEGGEYEA